MEAQALGQHGFAGLADSVGQAYYARTSEDVQGSLVVVAPAGQAIQDPIDTFTGLVTEQRIPAGKRESGSECAVGQNNDLSTSRTRFRVSEGVGEPCCAKLAPAAVELLHLGVYTRSTRRAAVCVFVAFGDQIHEG
jgi:hypothetical protein